MRSEEIYEALFDDEALARLPDLLCREAAARSAMLFWRHNDGLSETLAYNYFPKAMMDVYGAEWAARDPWVIGGLKSGRINEMVHLEPYVPAPIYENSGFYNEFIRRHDDDTFHCTGAILQSAWGQGVIGVQRGRRDATFDAGEVKRLAGISAHVERVLRARGEIASARRAAALAQGALDAVGLVAITLLPGGRIFHSNPAAEIVLKRADGLVARKGKLGAVHLASAKRLEAAIARATASFGPAAAAAMVDRGEGEPAYLVTITPLSGRTGEPAALLLFRDPAAPDDSLTMRLRALFGLTDAEAAVAIGLAGGSALADIARHRGVRVATLRSQLKSIAAKTGCNRQSELVALLRRLPPIARAGS
ncbi:MAG TPA: helix-turn-helix transcriptional regulator [Rhizomicrobium sp.]|nr:helix-turn-helix transcriptional regulator [Rhizomicrobium sp.]